MINLLLFKDFFLIWSIFNLNIFVKQNVIEQLFKVFIIKFLEEKFVIIYLFFKKKKYILQVNIDYDVCYINYRCILYFICDWRFGYIVEIGDEIYKFYS